MTSSTSQSPPPSYQASSGSAQILQPPPNGVSFNSGYVAKGERTFNIRCVDVNLRDATVSDETGSILFEMDGVHLLKSWSVRRSLKDSNGALVFDLRHYHSKMKEWVVEDAQGKSVCKIKDDTAYSANFTAYEAQVAGDAGDSTINIRSFDHAGTMTVFEVGHATFAELRVSENNDLPALEHRGLPRTVSKLKIAGGVDIAMALALAFCRLEILHTWRR